MLDKFLTLKIGDFGFARAGDQVSFTHSRSLLPLNAQDWRL